MVSALKTLFFALLIGLVAVACGDTTTTGDTDASGAGSAGESDSSVDAESSSTTMDTSEDEERADDEDAQASAADVSASDDTQAPEEDAQASSDDAEAPVEDVETEEDAELPGTSWPEIVINEVAPSGAPSDWVELLNRSDESVDLGGWTMTDDDPEHVHAFAEGQILGPGAYLLLLRDDAGGFTFGLGGADSISLFAPDGTQVDTTTWESGEAPEEQSWGRIPNGTGEFMTLETPTAGGANAPNTPQDCGNDAIELGEVCDGLALDDESCESFDFASGQLACTAPCDAFDFSACVPPSRIVVINEVTSSEDDRIELLNVSLVPVVISGWTLSDKDTAEPDQLFTIPPGLSLAPGEYAVFTKEIDHAFGLGGKDKVVLRDDTGLLIDRLSWPKDEAEISYCLIPNGGDTAQACEAQTFGGPND